MENQSKTLKMATIAIQKDLTDGIEQLHLILEVINNQDSIEPYASQYCENCDKSCGRTNAEIYTCIMNKKNQDQPEQDKNYTIDYLEKDLKHLMNTLENCQKMITTTLESYQST